MKDDNKLQHSPWSDVSPEIAADADLHIIPMDNGAVGIVSWQPTECAFVASEVPVGTGHAVGGQQQSLFGYRYIVNATNLVVPGACLLYFGTNERSAASSGWWSHLRERRWRNSGIAISPVRCQAVMETGQRDQIHANCVGQFRRYSAAPAVRIAGRQVRVCDAVYSGSDFILRKISPWQATLSNHRAVPGAQAPATIGISRDDARHVMRLSGSLEQDEMDFLDRTVNDLLQSAIALRPDMGPVADSNGYQALSSLRSLHAMFLESATRDYFVNSVFSKLPEGLNAPLITRIQLLQLAAELDSKAPLRKRTSTGRGGSRPNTVTTPYERGLVVLFSVLADDAQTDAVNMSL